MAATLECANLRGRVKTGLLINTKQKMKVLTLYNLLRRLISHINIWLAKSTSLVRTAHESTAAPCDIEYKHLVAILTSIHLGVLPISVILIAVLTRVSWVSMTDSDRLTAPYWQRQSWRWLVVTWRTIVSIDSCSSGSTTVSIETTPYNNK